jgi:ribosomal protein L18
VRTIGPIQKYQRDQIDRLQEAESRKEKKRERMIMGVQMKVESYVSKCTVSERMRFSVERDGKSLIVQVIWSNVEKPMRS